MKKCCKCGKEVESGYIICEDCLEPEKIEFDRDTYKSGFMDGFNEGYQRGYEDGKKMAVKMKCKKESSVETKWENFFDANNIAWESNRKVTLEDGNIDTFSFYLPESKTFFDVKQDEEHTDWDKIALALNAGNRVAVGYADMSFHGTNVWGDKCYTLEEGRTFLAKCNKCHHKWFMGELGSYVCPCCGHYDGDNGFEICAESEKTK